MSQPTVGVLDYGSGNLHSVGRALEAAGAQVVVGSALSLFETVDGLVVPGVGAFAACMAQLRAIGGDGLVTEWVGAQRKLLGICVGHQIFFSHGDEHAIPAAGIGVFPGTVERLRSRRLPHMGWNTIDAPTGNRIFAGLSGRHFYFVHSYAVHATDPAGRASVPDGAEIAWCSHESDRFIAAVQWSDVTSTQFHPEKSGAAGAKLLRNWLMS